MKNKKWIHRTVVILLCFCSTSAGKIDAAVDTTNQTPQDKDVRPVSSKDSRGLFSPRMDYEQWKPLGRGDPLKNDPTYDYVPPVLDRVHYWIDPSSRKPDPPIDSKKTEILVLGVSSKKPSVSYSVADSRRDQYDPYLQYVDSSNYNSYRIRRPEYGIPASYYPSPFYKITDKEPYTMLVPPPMMDSISYKPISTTSTTSVPTSIPIDEDKYQSSQPNWKGSNYATVAEPSSQVTWRTPINKTQLPQPSSFALIQNQQPSMTVVMKPLSNVKNMETDIIVAPETMHKGQVSDDTLDPSSTYVNIGKPDAQVQSTTGLESEALSTEPLTPPMENAPISFDYKKENKPMTLQMTMDTSTPPAVTQDFKKHSMLIHSIFKKEMTKPSTPFLPTVSPTTTTPTTTSASSLTTDPLFKHYKQPAEPMKGPLYLIIQGHSKVKTYGPSKQINGINIQETNEISTSEDRNLDPQFQVKHLHHEIKKEEWKREGRSSNLLNLNQVVELGLGSIEYDKEGERRIDLIRDNKNADRRIDYFDEEVIDDLRESQNKGRDENNAREDFDERNVKDFLEDGRGSFALESGRKGRRIDFLEGQTRIDHFEGGRFVHTLDRQRKIDNFKTEKGVNINDSQKQVDTHENLDVKQQSNKNKIGNEKIDGMDEVAKVNLDLNRREGNIEQPTWAESVPNERSEQIMIKNFPDGKDGEKLVNIVKTQRKLDNLENVTNLEGVRRLDQTDYLKILESEKEERKLKDETEIPINGSDKGSIEKVNRADEIKETELIVKYDVSSAETTSEVYHKGIVESDNPPSRPSLYAIIFNKKN